VDCDDRQSGGPPACHIEKLLAAGYIQESFTGPVLTDLGARLLAGEMRKKDASEQTPRAP
jgi:hypothetical protein